MPVCYIFTNIKEDDLDLKLAERMTETIAKAANKPVELVFVVVHAGLPSCMGGCQDPAILCQVRSVTSFKEKDPREYFSKFAATLKELTKVPADRILLELVRIPEGLSAFASDA